jgi:diacylglycerol kinase
MPSDWKAFFISSRLNAYFLFCYTIRMEQLSKRISEKKRFSLVARAKSFAHAFRGIGILLKTQPNFWVHILSALVVVYFGFFFSVSEGEWAALILAMALVVITEAVNTAIEIDIDLTSPESHPFARDTKDVAAGAVLLSVFAAIAIGLVIFLPKLLIL